MKKDRIFENILEDYLFEGSVEERKEKFEIAWGICENFEEIKKNMRKKVVEVIVRILKEHFPDYEISYEIKKGEMEPGFLKGEKTKGVYLYKKIWQAGNKYTFAYSIEPQVKNHSNIIFGIKKFGRKIPFEGEWDKTKPPGYELFLKIKGLVGNYKISEWWVIYKDYNNPYNNLNQKEMYLKMLENDGYEKIAQYYVNKLVELKKITEDLVDELAKIYKNKLEV